MQMNPLVHIEHVSRVMETHGRKIGILNDVTCTIPAQSLFSIIGPSGSGKSTLLNMLTGIDRQTSGRIVFAGEALRAMGKNALARWREKHIGIVFQFFQLLPTLTALENVLLALERGGAGSLPRRSWRERALTCLDMACVKHLAERLPGELSGGEQQRVAIARALANNPPVIVADEPTGNLDSRTAYQVFETLAGLRHFGKTIIYVTHDQTLAMQATAGIELRDGQVVGEKQANAAFTPARES
jgi:putative ABC transport system ATP-binding protein